VKPRHSSTATDSATPVHADVAAYGCVQATPDQFPALRQKPGPGIGQSLPNNFLKHADEQTVAALAAVLQAIEQFMMSETCFDGWGVVAAPFFLGRATLVQALQRYAAEGAWGLSPHFIPHRSQHAISGTISQALKIHGPNFGTGGGPGAAAEALLAGAVLLEGSRLPGVWVVLSGWDPEYVPDPEGRPTCETTCQAVALALVAPRPGCSGTKLSVLPCSRSERQDEQPAKTCPTGPTLQAVQQALRASAAETIPLLWELEGGGRIELASGGFNGCVPSTAFAPRTAGRPRTLQQAGAGTEKKR
jgi:hypothetical protein